MRRFYPEIISKFTFLVQKLPHLSLEEFIDYHKNKHAPLFCSIPETELYVRKYVVNHPMIAEGFPKPLYDAVVEISFDSFVTPNERASFS